MDDVLTLIGADRTRDARGVWVKSAPARREVFCKMASITRAEFYDAGRNGLNPSFRATVFAGEYNGENVCEYRGQTYAIYRTYNISGTDYLELYIERKGGSNGEQ